MKTDEAIYLFCLGYRDLLPAINGQGVEGDYEIEQCPFQDLVAVISRVPLRAFVGPDAEVHLQDIAWVAPRAYRHEEVVETAMRHSPVFPARFGTLFLSKERLLHLVETHYETIEGFIAYMSDKREWSVKVVVDEDIVAQSLVDVTDTDLSSPGARYLQGRQQTIKAKKKALPWVEATCNAIVEDLVQYTVDVCKLKALPAKASGRDGDVVLNLAVLLEQKDQMAFENRLEGLNRDHAGSGLEMALSGPWPPYSFCPALPATNADGAGERVG